MLAVLVRARKEKIGQKKLALTCSLAQEGVFSIEDFEPKIIAFCCNWCSYAGADLAGVSRFQYPSNIRIIRVMCSGRVETGFILKAFEKGADGVLVTGCHPGDCHYIAGNEKAQGQIAMAKELLATIGLGADRLRLEWISSSEGQRFASTVKEFVGQIKALGSNRISARTAASSRAGGSNDMAGGSSELREGGRSENGAGCGTGAEGNDGADRTHGADGAKRIQSIIASTKAYNCLDCGKCTGICPVTRSGQDYHPRGFVEKVVFKGREAAACDKSIWLCLTCGLCSQYCISGVKYPDLVRDIRAEAVKEGNHGECTHSEILHTIPRLMASASSELKQDRLQWLDKNLKTSKDSEYLFFTGCSPYFSILFKDIGVSAANLKASLEILNRLGIAPIILENEKCCGHDMLWTGEVVTFRELARQNTEMIAGTGAKKLVFACPECYRTFKLDYPRYLDDTGKDKVQELEMYHISEIIADGIEKGRLKFKSSEEEQKVTYQDPCRLGRHLGIYEPPRKVLSAIMGERFREMQRNRDRGSCCGTTCWTSCGAFSKQLQVERLKEAKDVAERLITACPHCEIHFRCAMSEDEPEVRIGIEDLSVFAVNNLKDDGRDDRAQSRKEGD